MKDWRVLANRASAIVGTPCYVMSERCIRESLVQLQALESFVPLRHWVSLKTQPVARVVEVAADLGPGIDVVSEYELAGALSAGVPGHRILVNGVGKHHWLARHPIPNLTVHFDSLAEVRALAVLAKALHWRVGLRCAIPEPDAGGEHDMAGWDQFGMTRDEVQGAATLLADAGVRVSGLHFHLHTNMHRVDGYRRALERVAEIAQSTQIAPEYIDVGGGLPVAGETSLDGVCAASSFDFTAMRELLASIPAAMPSVREVWLENGRFLTGPAGALVITVLDKKMRGDGTYLLCDGGRVNHARMAAMERHEILLSPMRAGALRKTVVCGPTCSAVDRLGCWMLPESIEPGDRVIWLTAGAYHLPLETRFSLGLAPVVWFDAFDAPEVIRGRETAAQWWGQWETTERRQYAIA